LSDNEIGDLGIKEIVNSCKDNGSLFYLDFSGNNIGKSSYSHEASEAFNEFLVNNR